MPQPASYDEPSAHQLNASAKVFVPRSLTQLPVPQRSPLSLSPAQHDPPQLPARQVPSQLPAQQESSQSSQSSQLPAQQVSPQLPAPQLSSQPSSALVDLSSQS